LPDKDKPARKPPGKPLASGKPSSTAKSPALFPSSASAPAKVMEPAPGGARVKSPGKPQGPSLVPPKPAQPVTYASAGVDISIGDRTKQRIKYLAQKTFNRSVLSEIGGFGGLFKLDTTKFTQPVLVSSADGVGTKLKIAFELGIHHTVGGDLVNHCVNDIAVQGATPLFFLDYLATGALDGEIAEKIVSGIADACHANGCALIGGETAQMPGFYQPGEYDLAGFIVGVVDRDKLITGARIQIGDVLIGLPSTGLHTNGYSLARKLFFEVAGYKADQYVNALKDKAGAALMKTHRSYLPVIKKLAAADLVTGMAHITGGGITENLPRILPRGIAAQVELGSWPVLPIFEHLQQLGDVEQEEMLRTFNLGIGLIATVPADKFKRVKAMLDRGNEKFYVIGRTVKGDRKVIYQ
jgi:phosphoribosylformylglycinamidine cyclo-ligase